MGTKLNLIRKTKWNFIRFRMHRIIGPFSDAMLNLAYLSKVSKWISSNRNIEFNDFYSSKWDYNKRYALYEYVMTRKQLTEKIHYLEFGVSGGHSFEWWVKHNSNPASRFTGFDTFEGLPENWGGFQKGAMSTNSRLPLLDDSRAGFVKGLFQETLPEYLKNLDKSCRKVIMMDADLYTSTLYVLTSLAPLLQKGDIIFFDQFNVPMHEFLAFMNFTTSYYLKMDLIAAANNYYFCAFELA
ncbi:MAG: class I SAM-dependent methyltransferase [Bacteroidetes bacterium]|nr:MAG: class I SAM-dependent methyltransferase [Bacteroidota bacterium]